jgi:GTP cyclohydrolase I
MKTDPELGNQVKDHLVRLGIETPMVPMVLTKQEQKEKIEEHFTGIMKALHLDLTDDSLAETSRRVSKMYVDEIFSGLDYSNFPKCSTFDDKMKCPEEFVLVKDITFHSYCEHHFLPILNKLGGGCSVAYIPKNKILGLSKINRICKFFGARPQVQERVGHQIMEALKYILDTEDVAVHIKAHHMCVEMRGVSDSTSITSTCAMGGRFKNDMSFRKEFLAAC